MDKTSGLDNVQRETLNTILFNHYRRFRRAASVVEADEPLVLKNFAYHTKNVQDVIDKSYGDLHTISFILRVKGLQKDGEVEIGQLKEEAPTTIFQSGGSGLTNSENIPGYFFFKGQRMMFRLTADIRYNDFFRCYIYWQN